MKRQCKAVVKGPSNVGLYRCSMTAREGSPYCGRHGAFDPATLERRGMPLDEAWVHKIKAPMEAAPASRRSRKQAKLAQEFKPLPKAREGTQGRSTRPSTKALKSMPLAEWLAAYRAQKGGK